MQKIYINTHWYEPLALYQKVNVTSIHQRSLLGYMVTNGYLRDPIYGGAFSLLMELEDCDEVPIVIQKISDNEKAQEIVSITDIAMTGGFDEFALDAKFIRDAKISLERERKGGKGK